MPVEVQVQAVEPQAISMEVESTTTKANTKAAAPSGGMPMTAKLAHALAIIVSGVIAVAVSTVLADGTSVIRLKDAAFLKPATNPALKSQGINHRLDQLLGSTYGVGLHHDQSGHSWTAVSAGSTLSSLIANLGMPVVIAALPSVISTDDLKHPVPFLECNELQMAGLCAMWFGYIAEVVAVVMLIFHTLSLAGLVPAKLGKIGASLVWAVLSAGFLVVIMLAIGIYNATWTCHQPIIPTIRLSDHFNYNYGFAYAIAGFASALLILNTTLCLTSTKDGEAGQPAVNLAGAIVKMLGGITVGAIVAIVAGVVVCGATGAFDPEPVADPNVNPCEGTKPYSLGPGDKYFKNQECFKDAVTQTLEQAGANVTKGYVGGMDAGDRIPITVPYSQTDLCPVNVHWHLGAEHLSVGQYDEHGHGPNDPLAAHRQLASTKQVRRGGQCHHYNDATKNDAKFTKPYTWEHCTDMQVGATYEIHWPHSAAGACGTPYQYQTPFYDGVFCNEGMITIAPLNTYKKIGVQAQIFTVVNDEDYYNGDLINGMIVDGDKGADMAIYTGSTTGTSRDNEVCSRFTPITWQVDRKCHMISASSFDKLCADMKMMKDDMSGDLHPHGAREVVAHELTANNQQSRK